ncbi:hypothetical protein QCN27_18015 [Cereibacter sp. SYSU M97828]|nr:hypothetical protein [Cereibacter flavus]
MANVPAIVFCQDKFMKVLALSAALATLIAAPSNAATMKWTFDGWVLGYEYPTNVYADYAPKVGSKVTATVTFDSEYGRKYEPEYGADWISHVNVTVPQPPKVEFSFDEDFAVDLTSYGIGFYNWGSVPYAQVDGGGSDGRFPGWNTSFFISQPFAFPEGVSFESEFTAEAIPLLFLENIITLYRDVWLGELMDVFFCRHEDDI